MTISYFGDSKTACTSVGNFIALSGENKIFAGTDCKP